MELKIILIGFACALAAMIAAATFQKWKGGPRGRPLAADAGADRFLARRNPQDRQPRNRLGEQGRGSRIVLSTYAKSRSEA